MIGRYTTGLAEESRVAYLKLVPFIHPTMGRMHFVLLLCILFAPAIAVDCSVLTGQDACRDARCVWVNNTCATCNDLTESGCTLASDACTWDKGACTPQPPLDATLTWVILGAVFLVLEIFTPGIFFILFGVSSFIVAAAVGIGLISGTALGVQTLVFLLTSIVLLAFVRPMFNVVTVDTGERFGVEAFVGKVGTVTEDIEPEGDKGKVKVTGEEWRADADMPLEKGTKVEVIELKSNTLIVKVYEKEE